MAREIRTRHQLETKLGGTLRRERQADEPAAMFGHEVDGIRRGHLRRNYEIAFVLALLGVDENKHAAVACVLHHLLDGREVLAVRRPARRLAQNGHVRRLSY
jgi:hypothetical protein